MRGIANGITSPTSYGGQTGCPQKVMGATAGIRGLQSFDGACHFDILMPTEDVWVMRKPVMVIDPPPSSAFIRQLVNRF